MAKFNEDELLGQLYVDNLFLKAQGKLLRDLLVASFSMEDKENAGKKILDAYFEKIEGYYEDQILLSPLKDEYLQKQAEEFLKQMKDGLL